MPAKEWPHGARCSTIFPKVDQRIKLSIPKSHQITANVMGHEKIKVYLTRFKITDKTICACNEVEQ